MIAVVNGKKINYEQYGKGQPVLFVHGWGGSIDSLKPLAMLASKKYRSIILDLPGFGKSDAPEADWGVGEYSQLIIDFIRQLGLNDVTFFGHSFGGSLGINIASNDSKVINKLILCGSAFRRTNSVSTTTQSLKNVFNTITFLKTIEPQVKKIYYRIFFPNSDLTKYPRLETNFRKIMAEDLTGQLEKIKQPVLVLWGNKDTYTPVNLTEILKLKIVNCKLKIFPDVGHNLPLKYPELVYKEIEKFI